MLSMDTIANDSLALNGGWSIRPFPLAIFTFSRPVCVKMVIMIFRKPSAFSTHRFHCGQFKKSQFYGKKTHTQNPHTLSFRECDFFCCRKGYLDSVTGKMCHYQLLFSRPKHNCSSLNARR